MSPLQLRPPGYKSFATKTSCGSHKFPRRIGACLFNHPAIRVCYPTLLALLLSNTSWATGRLIATFEFCDFGRLRGLSIIDKVFGSQAAPHDLLWTQAERDNKELADSLR
jgi:hypothetical protein